MQRKICFIIDASIIEHHHGVRRLVYSLVYAMRSAGYLVDMLHYDFSTHALKKVNVDEITMLNNGFSGNYHVASSKSDILDMLASGGVRLGHKMTDISYNSSDNMEDEYDSCVLAGPWVYKPGMSLPSAKSYYCIACDVVPNRYYLASPNNVGLRDFAYAHTLGYRWADEHGKGLLCITKETQKQCEIFGFGANNGLGLLPTLMPPGYEREAEKNDETERRNIAILAAPFDRRKGLLKIPSIVNAGCFEKLVIYGRPRCAYEDIVSFFNKLNIENIEWWLDVDYEKQVELYNQSKVLIFPSINEGLGLPVLEAYACGVSVLVSDISPLNELVLTEDILSDDIDKAISQVALRSSVTCEPNRYRRWASQHWGTKQFIENLVLA